jgi:hypothetical protein
MVASKVLLDEPNPNDYIIIGVITCIIVMIVILGGLMVMGL